MFGMFKKKDHEIVEDKAKDEKPADTADAATPPEQSAPERDNLVPPPGYYDRDDDFGGLAYSPLEPGQEFIAKAGSPLAADAEVAGEDAVIEALRTVYDPEIPVNIYDLGLIYTCEISDNGNVKIEMSLTAPGCPVAGEMPGMVARAVETVEGTGEIEVELVWEPQWTMALMSEDAKLALGMG